MMKKVFLVLAMVAVFNVSSYAYYSRTTSNGGFFGYDYVSEERDGENTTISCSNPGWSSCPRFAPSQENPSTPTDETTRKLIELALGAIEKGQFSGKAVFNQMIVVWKSDNQQMTNSYIRVTDF